MKHGTFIIAIVSLTFLSSMTIPFPSDICSLIKSTSKNQKHDFNPELNSKVDTKRLKLLDKQSYELLFDQRMSSSDSSYLIGKFNISKNRVGLLCYTSTIECDHHVDYITLHIIDNCKVIDTKYISSQDSDGFIYERKSNLSTNFDTLTVTLEQSSDWAMEINSNIDTLFTDIFKINLRSEKLDTVFKSSTFKPFKYNEDK